MIKVMIIVGIVGIAAIAGIVSVGGVGVGNNYCLGRLFQNLGGLAHARGS